MFAARLMALAVCTATLSSVAAQTVTSTDRAPTLTIERYPEDWSYLANPANRSGRWTEQFKYIPLNGDGSVYLSTGIELRSRFEGYQNVAWGAARDDRYVWHRAMPYADLHAGSVRLFAQPIFSTLTMLGADRPTRPVDTTGADMLQGFAEVELDVAERSKLRLSAGRKLLSLGGGRLVDTRYGPNVPQPFEGLDATLALPTSQVRVLLVRPVDTRPGDFDDRALRQKTLWGVYGTRWLAADRSVGFDLYYLGLRDQNAFYDQGTGEQVVHSYGGRVFGDTGTWHWNLEGVLQGGTFAGHRVQAWGGGGEVGYTFHDQPLKPDLSFTAEVISGDSDRDDPTLQTFNPLFPKGKYFGALTPIGPRNLIHLRPTITVSPFRDVSVSLVGAAYWRQSKGDGIYAIPGNLVRSGESSDARFIGTQVELTVAWQVTPELNVTVSASAFEPGAFIRETGPARTISMVGATVNYRF